MQIISDKNPLTTYLKAADICYKAVAHTLGPGGTNTAVVNKSGSHDIINDGYSILSKLTSLDPAEAEALETIKLASFETNRKAGDGTTSTLILTYKLLESSINYLEANKISRVKLRKILEDARDYYLETLQNLMSIKIEDNNYEHIAKVSLGSSKYAKLVSDAYRFLPTGLRPSIVRCDSPDVTLDEKDGLVLDKVDVIVAEDTFQSGPKEFVDVDTYVIYEKLDRWNMIQPIVEQIIRLKRKAIIFYNELSMDILQNLELQIVRGYADIIPIRMGSLGLQTKSTMSQLAKYTNTTLIDGVEVRLPKALNQINIGKLDYILINRDTVVVNNKDFTDLDSITLPTRTCIIRIGGANKAEMEETYKRIEDAVNSLGNAIESGISLGAGITYRNLAKSNEEIPLLIREAMNSIHNQVVYNLLGDCPEFPDEYPGLIPDDNGDNKPVSELNIFDATEVIRQVIINSFTLVAQIITTNVMIVESVR